jgi:hypothetical protein
LGVRERLFCANYKNSKKTKDKKDALQGTQTMADSVYKN